jgi:hypothetical protein
MPLVGEFWLMRSSQEIGGANVHRSPNQGPKVRKSLARLCQPHDGVECRQRKGHVGTKSARSQPPFSQGLRQRRCLGWSRAKSWHGFTGSLAGMTLVVPIAHL